MSPGREFFPDTNERVCLIIGDKVELEQTVACFQHLIQLIRKDSDEFERKRKPQDADRKNQVRNTGYKNILGSRRKCSYNRYPVYCITGLAIRYLMSSNSHLFLKISLLCP